MNTEYIYVVQEYFYLSVSVTFWAIEVSVVDSCHDEM